jgi:sugar/nucleoside kinase (ribokinase family)
VRPGRILVVGDVNVDLVLAGARALPAPGKEVLADDFTMALGGASAICAVGLARLGDVVWFRGKVGADPWGDFCLDALAREGVDVSLAIRDPALKTGVTVSITSPEDRALVTYPGAVAALTADEVPDALFAGIDHVHVASYFLQRRLRPGCRALLGRARRRGLTTSLDPGFDPAEAWGVDLLDALEEVDFFFPNEVELRAVSGAADPDEALRRLRDRRARTVAKLGARGCATLDGDEPLRVPPFPIDAVDTTGAGDSFDAGFLHAWLQGRPLLDCLRTATACGALSTRCPGGTGGQPRSAEVEALLGSAP